MAMKYQELPEFIQGHLKRLLKSSDLPDTEENREKMTQAWSEKDESFEKELAKQGLEKVETFTADDPRAAVVLTYSGSLMLLGPILEEGRKVGYNSIGIRKGVPETAVREKSKLAKEVQVDQSLELEVGPVKKTSPIYKIGVCNPQIPLLEQEEVVTDITIALTQVFVDVNKTVLIDK